LTENVVVRVHQYKTDKDRKDKLTMILLLDTKENENKVHSFRIISTNNNNGIHIYYYLETKLSDKADEILEKKEETIIIIRKREQRKKRQKNKKKLIISLSGLRRSSDETSRSSTQFLSTYCTFKGFET